MTDEIKVCGYCKYCNIHSNKMYCDCTIYGNKEIDLSTEACNRYKERITKYPTWQEAINSKEFKGE